MLYRPNVPGHLNTRAVLPRSFLQDLEGGRDAHSGPLTPSERNHRSFLWLNFQVQFQRGLTSVQSCWFSPDAPWGFPQGHPGVRSGGSGAHFADLGKSLLAPGCPWRRPPGAPEGVPGHQAAQSQAAQPGESGGSPRRPCEAGCRRVHRALGAIGGARPGAHGSAPGTVWSLSSQGSLPPPLVPLRGQTCPWPGAPRPGGVLPPGGHDPPGRAQVWKAPGICPIYSGQQADWSVPRGHEVWAPRPRMKG